jgi:hypothetical protein
VKLEVSCGGDIGKVKPMTTPPVTPQARALKGVLRLSAIDSWSIVVIAGLSLLLTLATFELMGIMISALVLAGGLIEMRGRKALQRRDATTGMKLLVRAQLLILTVLLVYCARCLGSFDAGYVRDELIPEANQMLLATLGISLSDFLAESGMTVEELVTKAHLTFVLLYSTVAALSLLFQGGLALYYRNRTQLVGEALAVPPQPPLA